VACSNGKVADLLPSGLDWYIAATGGAALAPATALSSLGSSPLTLYASQTVNGAESTTRTAVTVTLADCSSAPAGAITTFVRVMYDFQHQTLEAYKTGTADAIGFKWQVSRTTNDADFKYIPGAFNSKYYTIPAGFYDASSTTTLLAGQTEDEDKSLYFRCVLTNPAGTFTTQNDFNIIFINTSGYATDSQGRKYVTLGKGSGGQTVPDGSTATMKVLLLNLGQSGDSYTPGSSDAADLGDFYQWGRVADGHEHVVWSKDASTHANIITPNATGNYPVTEGKTSGAVSRSLGMPSFDVHGQVESTDMTFYGKFIGYIVGSGGEWTGNGVSNRWGNGTPIANRSNSDWIHPSNNPCPAADGWKVPRVFDWWDLYIGTGSDAAITSNYGGINNTLKSFHTVINNTFGGTVITSKALGHESERVFLPNCRARSGYTGALNTTEEGNYWNVNFASGGFFLRFNSSNVDYFIETDVSRGHSVRCVAD
jgi:hypothetical protein